MLFALMLLVVLEMISSVAHTVLGSWQWLTWNHFEVNQHLVINHSDSQCVWPRVEFMSKLPFRAHSRCMAMCIVFAQQPGVRGGQEHLEVRYAP